MSAGRSNPAGLGLSPRLLRAYRETCYQSCGIAVLIGRRSDGLDALLRALGSTCGGFVTAWNPASRRLPAGINHRRQRRLIERLRGARCVAAQGSLRRWHEAHLLVAADPRVLAVLARRFGQAAIVVLRARRRARLLLL